MTLENFQYRTDSLFLRDQFSKQADIFGIPIIPKPYFSHEELQNLRLLGFDQVKRDEGKHRNRMVHFFLYDYKFEKIWDNSEPFVDLLRPYRAVLTPDFSMYTEMPPALQLYNTFRNRWCGAYLAEQGLRVVPTVSWGTEESFDFCFAGFEKGSIVAVSTYMFHAHGNHADQKELFMNGYRELLRRIQPEYVICYSEPFPEMEGNLIYVDYDLSSWKHMEDDEVIWEAPDQHPRLGPPINYGPPFNDNPVPDITSYLPGGKSFMESNIVKQPQHIEYEHFESISDFKWCMHCGGEVEFYYRGVGYTVTHPDGFINISKFCRPDTELESHDVEEILNYLMDDGKKLREVIKEVDVDVA